MKPLRKKKGPGVAAIVPLEIHDAAPAPSSLKGQLARLMNLKGFRHQLELKDAELTQEGFLRCRAVVTGVGVLDYQRLHGVHMFRPEDEVFKPESMESLKGVPVTLGHPPANVTSETAREYLIGYTGDQVWREGDQLCCNLTLIEGWVIREVLALLEQGQRIQFSVGYWAFPDRTEGDYNGQAYQITQRAIQYNHLALLLNQPGRYPFTELLTDSQDPDGSWLLMTDGQLTANDSQNSPEEPPTVFYVTLSDGTRIQVADQATADKMQADIDGLKTKASTAAGAQAAAERKAQKQMQDAADARAKEKAHVKLCNQAVSYLDGVELDELLDMDTRAVQSQVLIADGAFDEATLQAMDAQSVAGAYAYMVATNAAGQAATAELLDAATVGTVRARADKNQNSLEIVDAAEDAQIEMFKRMQEQRKRK